MVANASRKPDRAHDPGAGIEQASLHGVKTATKPQKMKKEVRKIRRELGGVLIVIARLKATAEQIEQLPEVSASCPE